MHMKGAFGCRQTVMNDPGAEQPSQMFLTWVKARPVPLGHPASGASLKLTSGRLKKGSASREAKKMALVQNKRTKAVIKLN